MPCRVSEERLFEWLDGELNHEPTRAHEREEIERELQRCEVCRQRVEDWHQMSRELRGLIDAGVGKTEPLHLVQRIHEQVAEHAQSSWQRKARTWLGDVWLDKGFPLQTRPSDAPLAQPTQTRAWVVLAAAVLIALVVGPILVRALDATRADSLLGSAQGYVAAEGTTSALMASVVVESLEFDGRSRAVVYHPAADTTVIWVDREGSIDVGEF